MVVVGYSPDGNGKARIAGNCLQPTKSATEGSAFAALLEKFTERGLAVNSGKLLQIEIFGNFFDGFFDLRFNAVESSPDLFALAFSFSPRFNLQDLFESDGHA